MRRRNILFCSLILAYGISAVVFTPRLKHAWWYFQENASRTHTAFVGLTAASILYPWCLPYAREAWHNLAHRGAPSPWNAELIRQLPSWEKAELIDARTLSMARMKGILATYKKKWGGYRLWCVGRWDYLVTPRDPSVAGNVISSKLLAAFADEKRFEKFASSRIYSPADMLASYVGDDRDLAPAFASFYEMGAFLGLLTAPRTIFNPIPQNGLTPVRPTYLTPAEGADMRWFKKGETERAVYATLGADILAKQKARREILSAFDLAEAGKHEEAIAKWRAGAAVNPRDPVLTTLADALDREASVYLSLGNPNAALKCLENKLGIFPEDAPTLYSIATCLQRKGDARLALQVTQKAKALETKAALRGKGLLK